ncbi:hypothetical protein ILUMI_04421 [Ignelater luminosus]|uniref:Uncharacterized protein n=1 Tax=Ignelater luminosus TaxID=2038154 RepID=A0A8K0D961_IGNLU|nr:hypothetical protein ILUMI_04421 [Ignelater luminosus]
MSSSGRVLPLARLCARQFSQSAVRRAEVPSENFQKLKVKQQKFQVDDGVPVYIKGGMLDKILYQATVAGTTVGVILGIQVFLTLANK